MTRSFVALLELPVNHSDVSFCRAFAVAALTLIASACSCGGVGTGDEDPLTGSNGDDPSATADGGGGGQNPDGPTAPFPIEQACHTSSSQASLTKRPVDVIVVIDNSGSMTLEIESVENNVNSSFGQILEASGVDYRVILLAKHGTASADQSVCIRAPLSGTNCSPVPSKPVNGARFFHYDLEISSTNSLSRVLETYDVTDVHGFAPGGWKSWLRPDSIKTFVEITDDESSLSADEFEAGLFALQPAGTFGDANQRNFIFHSIIGIVPNSPTTAAWQPSDGVKNSKCGSAARAGARYEDLSIRTGGLRFPVCETSSYDAVFQAAAQDVIASATVACSFTPPAPPAGAHYAKSYVEYTPGNGGAVQYLLPRGPGEACASDRFELDATTNRITLCPEACELVRADPSAKLVVAYACGGSIG